MATKGPSFAGPLTGWSAASLVPQSAVAAVSAPTPVVQPGPSDISKYNLTPSELAGGVPNARRSGPQATPLESLLAAMFPDAAAEFNPAGDPMANPRSPGQVPSLFNTILGNLDQEASVSPGYYQSQPPASFVAPSIPGAPAFLGQAVANLGGFSFGAPAVPVPGANPLNSLAAVSALAAEQRIQAAEQEKARKEAETAYFQQQQEKQKAQSMVAQRQRQRFGSVNATTSGWSSNPTFF